MSYLALEQKSGNVKVGVETGGDGPFSISVVVNDKVLNMSKEDYNVLKYVLENFDAGMNQAAKLFA